MVGVELGANGQLAGGLYVYELYVGEVYCRRTPEACHAAEGFAQVVYGKEIQLAPQLDLYASVLAVPYFRIDQLLPFANE